MIITIIKIIRAITIPKKTIKSIIRIQIQDKDIKMKIIMKRINRIKIIMRINKKIYISLKSWKNKKVQISCQITMDIMMIIDLVNIKNNQKITNKINTIEEINNKIINEYTRVLDNNLVNMI